MHEALVALADLAIRSATLLPVRMDLMEVLRLLHKDGRAVREEVHATALPASICTIPTRYRRPATARLVVILVYAVEIFYFSYPIFLHLEMKPGASLFPFNM